MSKCWTLRSIKWPLALSFESVVTLTANCDGQAEKINFSPLFSSFARSNAKNPYIPMTRPSFMSPRYWAPHPTPCFHQNRWTPQPGWGHCYGRSSSNAPNPPLSPPCEQSLLLSSWGEEGLCLNCVKPFESPHAQTLLSNWFFKCEHSFIDKPMVITEPVVPSARLLGIGSKLYLSNMQRYSPKSSQRKKGSASREETASSPVTLFSPRSVHNQ